MKNGWIKLTPHKYSEIFSEKRKVCFTLSRFYFKIIVKISLLGGDHLKVINRVKALREEKMIAQNDLASILEVSRQTIHAIEKGKYNPSLELSLKIAKFFELTVEEIFQLEEE